MKCVVTFLLTVVFPLVCCAQQKQAVDILGAAGVKGGLVVHVGCGEGKQTAARQHIQSVGLYGPVSVGRCNGGLLPHMDNARVHAYDGETTVALDRKDDRLLWTSEAVEHKDPFPAGYGPTLVVKDGVVLLSVEQKAMSGRLADSKEDGLFTGEVKNEFPCDNVHYWFRHSCYRAKAAEHGDGVCGPCGEAGQADEERHACRVLRQPRDGGLQTD
jgi:hypothetical protein